jgi:hypothetical protein
MKYAIIKNGVVINVIEYEEQPSTPPAGFSEGHEAIQTDVASPNWHYANGVFTDPNPLEQSQFDSHKSLTDMILESPTELAKLKQALGLQA